MAARDAQTITCTATLKRPVAPKHARWSFVVLPRSASARLPTRAMTAVEGTLAGHRFRATLAPDGQGSHWLKVPDSLRIAAGVNVGDTVALAMVPSSVQPEARVPADLRRALASAPEAQARWSALTPVARRDWIQWLDSAKKGETRERRIASTCDMLVAGKRRVCCFDRSGIYGKAVGAPVAAE